MIVDILDSIAPIFHDLAIDCLNNLIDELELTGGRGSTKSSFTSLIIPYGMMSDYHENKELTNAVVLRKVGNTLHESVYNQLLWALDKMGVSEYWKCTTSPLRMTYKPSGQSILFRGCDDPMKIKSTKFEKGWCKYVWFEEYNQFDGPKEISMVNQSLVRGKECLVLYTYNPLPEEEDWANVEHILNLEQRVQHHSDYTMIPKDWLGEKFIKFAERKKETNLSAYKNEYLGLITGVSGNIFKNVVPITLSNYEIAQFDNWNYGLDFGFAIDPSHFVKNTLKQKNLWIYDEICEVELPTKELAKQIIKKTAFKELIKADSAEPRTINSLQKDYHLNVVACKKGADSVRHGMKWLQDLDNIYIDKKRAPQAYAEFKFYKYMKNRLGEFINEFPDKNNHSIDATRYSLDDVILTYGWKMPKVKPN